MLPNLTEWFAQVDWAALAWRQVWQIAVVVLFVQVMVFAFARRRPHLAYLLWMVVVVKCLTPPIWTSDLGLFSWATAERALPSEAVEPKVAPPVLADAMEFDDMPRTALSASQAAVDAPGAWEQSRLQTEWIPLLLLGVWAAGACGVGCVVCRRWRQYRRYARFDQAELPEELLSLAGSVATELGVRRRPRLAIDAENVLGPAAFGVVRPTIVLPRRLLDTLSSDGLRAVLAHELVHVRRHDPAAALLQVAALVLWWFHPLVWWASRQATRSRELACDEEAVRGTALRSRDYVNSLVDVLESQLRTRAVGLFPAATATPMTKGRIVHLVSCEGRLLRRTPVWCWLVAIAAVVALLPGKERSAAQQAVLVATPTADESDAGESNNGESVAGDEPATRKVTITGQVMDPDGKPVAGATVYMLSAPGPPVAPRQFESLGTVTTDREGWYEFTEAPLPVAGQPQWGSASDVVVFATADRHGLAWNPGFIVNIAPTGEVHASAKQRDQLTMTSTFVATGDGEPPQVPMAERRAIMDLTLARPATISGRLLEEDGQPLAGATIRLVEVGRADSRDSAQMDSSHAPGFRTRTNESGEWKLTGLADQTWIKIEIDAPGFVTTAALVATSAEAANRPGSSGPLPVGQATVTLARPRPVELLLSDNSSGTAIANEPLTLFAAPGNHQSIALSAESDDRGLARLRLPPADYRVQFGASDRDSPYQFERNTVTVTADTDEQLLALELTPAATVDFHVVEDATGKPVPQAAITAEVPGAEKPHQRYLPNFLIKVTDKSGQILACVEPATAQFKVVNIDWQGWEVVNPLAKPVEFKAGETFAHTFRLKKVDRSVLPTAELSTEGVSEKHLQAVEALHEFGAMVSWNVVVGGQGPEVQNVYAIVTQHWSGGAEGLRLLHDLDGPLMVTFMDYHSSATEGTDSEPPLVTDEWLAALEGLDAQQLNIKRSNLTNAGLRPLASLKNLRVLDLTAPDVTDDGLRHLSGLSNLQMLQLSAAITDEGLEHLAGVEQLKHVEIISPNLIADGLAQLPTGVNWLRLSVASDESVAIAADRFRQLIHLNVAGHGVTDAGLRQVAKLEQLRMLELHGTSITAEGLTQLANPHLEMLALSGASITDDTIAPLERRRGLKVLRLVKTSVTEAGLAKLRAANRRVQIRTR